MLRFTPAKLCDFSGNLEKQWYVYYSAQEPDTGKMVRFKVSGEMNRAKTKKERKEIASRYIQEINYRLSLGWNPFVNEVEKKLTLEELFTDYLLIKKSTVKHRTWQSYSYAVNKFRKHIQKTLIIYPQDVTSPIARGFIDSLSREGKAGKTVNEVKGFLFTMFGMMVDREIIEKNPFAKIPPLPQDGGRNLAYSREELEKIWKHFKSKNEGWYIFSRVIYFCYIRPVELLRLKVNDIDWQKGVITIAGENSKNRKTQVVVIPSTFLVELKEWVGDAPTSNFLMGFKYQPSPRPMSRNGVSLMLNRELRKLGFSSGHTLYAFKHSGVVAAYQAGIDLYSISRQLRHHSLVITQVYMKSLGLMPNTEFASKMV